MFAKLKLVVSRLDSRAHHVNVPYAAIMTSSWHERIYFNFHPRSPNSLEIYHFEHTILRILPCADGDV